MASSTPGKTAPWGEAPWTIAVFTARESVDTVVATLRAAIEAAGARAAPIDVLVNGNPTLAERLHTAVTRGNLAAHYAGPVRIWHIPLADKAHAWNVYVHHLAPRSDTAFFIDGYARVNPDALEHLHKRLHADPKAIAATGVPSTGRSAGKIARQMVSEGGIHGNLFAIEGATVTRLRESGFRLPLGLYRTDGTIGAVLNFNLDPSTHPWDPARTAVVPAAGWSVPRQQWWRPRDLLTQWRRMFRQAQGALENAAVREHLAVQQKRPRDMPRTNPELVLGWLRDNPAKARAVMLRHPLSWLAVRRLRQGRDWSLADEAPQRVGERVKDA
jgi:hypothetical protein